MAQNQTADWYPLGTGNAQYDENQRRIWDNLYYLRDQGKTSSANATSVSGMSATVTFRDSNNNAVSLVIGGKTFSSLTFANGVLVSTK